ncbi:MAG: branched-chain amino acid aminotransferase [Verrucomicrobiales bacterium]
MAKSRLLEADAIVIVAGLDSTTNDDYGVNAAALRPKSRATGANLEELENFDPSSRALAGPLALSRLRGRGLIRLSTHIFRWALRRSVLPLPSSKISTEMGIKVHIDGQLLDEQDAKISVFDHGLLYGDGVFEGIRFYEGRVFECKEHIDRLFDSAKAIALDIQLTREEVTEAMMATIRANELRDGYVRLVVTRGTGTLGLNPLHCPKASVIVIADKIQLYPPEKYENGLTLVTCSTRRPTPASLSPLVKSLNYLNNVMAKLEALNAGGEEGLMLNEEGNVAECTGDNIFIVKKGRISTPPLSAGALNGITRRVMFKIAAQLGIDLVEENQTRYEVYTADEIFLTGTAAEVVPVATCDGRAIGDGKPGEMSRRFMAEFRKMTKNSGTPIYN